MLPLSSLFSVQKLKYAITLFGLSYGIRGYHVPSLLIVPSLQEKLLTYLNNLQLWVMSYGS